MKLYQNIVKQLIYSPDKIKSGIFPQYLLTSNSQPISRMDPPNYLWQLVYGDGHPTETDVLNTSIFDYRKLNKSTAVSLIFKCILVLSRIAPLGEAFLFHLCCTAGKVKETFCSSYRL